MGGFEDWRLKIPLKLMTGIFKPFSLWSQADPTFTKNLKVYGFEDWRLKIPWKVSGWFFKSLGHEDKRFGIIERMVRRYLLLHYLQYLLLITTCYYLSILTTTYHYLILFDITYYYYLILFISTYNYLLLVTTIYYYLLLLVTSY